MILYNLRTTPENTYCVTKFDDDMNVESSYDVSAEECQCPQGHKPTCRHRKMLPAMQAILDTEFFYCFDTQTYHTVDGEHYSPAVQQAQPGPSVSDLRLTPMGKSGSGKFGSPEAMAPILSPGQRFRRL